MLICLNVGNSEMHGGVFHHDKLLCQCRFPCREHHTTDEIGIFLKQVLREHNIESNHINHVAICSVVPSIDYLLQIVFTKYFSVDPFFLQPGVKTGLNILRKNPQDLGADRTANAIAATAQFPEKNKIIIYLQTATTIDVINSKDQYLGGVIMPGLKTAMESLYFNTEKLRPVPIIKPKNIIGQTTIANIQSGLYYGHLGALREITTGIHQQMFNNNATTIATGEFAYLFNKTSLFDICLDDLTLQGLRLVYQKNNLNISHISMDT